MKTLMLRSTFPPRGKHQFGASDDGKPICGWGYNWSWWVRAVRFDPYEARLFVGPSAWVRADEWAAFSPEEYAKRKVSQA